MKNYSTNLRDALTVLAQSYSKMNNLKDSSVYKSSVIFNSLKDNFQPRSYNAILDNPKWKVRLDKPHQKVKGAKELQSSNSSDGLLMNIFCYPKVKEWKGMSNLFGVNQITSIEFGHNPSLKLNSKPEPRPTEIDLVINDSINIEAKLTEVDFTSDKKNKILGYNNFTEVFDTSQLPQSKEEYLNYQLIRNILAAHVENRRFILLCDMRRTDLIQSLFQTVMCIKDVHLRNRCSFITWQDISKSVGSELKKFLENKYGIK